MSMTANTMLSHLESLLGNTIDHDNSGVGYSEEVIQYLLKKYWAFDLRGKPIDWDLKYFPSGFDMGDDHPASLSVVPGDIVLVNTTREHEKHVGIVKGVSVNRKTVILYSQFYHHPLTITSYDRANIYRVIRPNFSNARDDVKIQSNEYRVIPRKQDNYFSIILGSGPDAVDIGQMVDAITKIDRGVGSGWNNVFAEDGGKYGSRWVKTTTGSKHITVDFIKVGDQAELTKFRREFAAAIDTSNGPKRLSFNDQPNVYYNAVVDGEVSLDEDIYELQATGTITFVVPDGLAHSTFTNVLSEGGENESLGSIEVKEDHHLVTINNNGTVEAFPRIIIEHRDDNGYIAIVNQNGALEIGNTNQGPVGTDSQVLLSTKWGDYTEQTGLGRFNLDYVSLGITTSPHATNDGLLPLKNHLARVAGKVNAQGMMNPIVMTPRKGYVWTSGFSAMRLPADSNGERTAKNFKLDFNVKTWQEIYYDTGHIAIGVLDENKELVCAVNIEKDIDTTSLAWVYLYDAKDSVRIKQPFLMGVSEFFRKYGECSLIKEGSKLTFQYADTVMSFNIPAIENKKAAYLYVSAGTRSDIIGTNGMATKMCLETIAFTKFDVERWDLVKKRYIPGSRITVDQKQGIIYYAHNSNAGTIGGPKQSDLVFGSTFFSLPPGTSQLKILRSAWSKRPPKISIEWEESWR